MKPGRITSSNASRAKQSWSCRTSLRRTRSTRCAIRIGRTIPNSSSGGRERTRASDRPVVRRSAKRRGLRPAAFGAMNLGRSLAAENEATERGKSGQRPFRGNTVDSMGPQRDAPDLPRPAGLRTAPVCPLRTCSRAVRTGCSATLPVGCSRATTHRLGRSRRPQRCDHGPPAVRKARLHHPSSRRSNQVASRCSIERIGEKAVVTVPAPLWGRPILKRDALGLRGPFACEHTHHHQVGIPPSTHAIDGADRSMSGAQRGPFDRCGRFVRADERCFSSQPESTRIERLERLTIGFPDKIASLD